MDSERRNEHRKANGAVSSPQEIEAARETVRPCQEVRFARDGRGKPTASSPPPIEAVGAFFEREVARDPGLGDWILETIGDIQSGRELAAQQVSSEATESYVTIDNSYGEETVEVCCAVGEAGEPYEETLRDHHGAFLLCTVRRPDFQNALENWLAFIRQESEAS